MLASCQQPRISPVLRPLNIGVNYPCVARTSALAIAPEVNSRGCEGTPRRLRFRRVAKCGVDEVTLPPLLDENIEIPSGAGVADRCGSTRRERTVRRFCSFRMMPPKLCVSLVRRYFCAQLNYVSLKSGFSKKQMLRRSSESSEIVISIVLNFLRKSNVQLVYSPVVDCRAGI